MNETPAALGFQMPPEWAPHARTWMAWPCHAATFGDGMIAARAAYARVANAIAGFEPVTMIARPQDAAAARKSCGQGVEIIELPLSDSWTRDTGPTFLVRGDGTLAGVDWRFNAWGGNYPEHEEDAALAARILDIAGATHFSAPIVFEGGALHVDGAGTALTTDSVLLNPNRNPGLAPDEAERILRDHLGVETVIRLGNGLEYDDTDGHVDNLACFAAPGRVLALDCADPDDPQYAPLKRNIAMLEAARDARGRSLEVIPLVHPARREQDGQRLALSYVNFYICNGGVIVPVFDDPADAEALATIRDCFPGREVVAVPGLDIVRGGGCVHCITQQQPKV
jgi:agmatine deiminase